MLTKARAKILKNCLHCVLKNKSIMNSPRRPLFSEIYEIVVMYTPHLMVLPWQNSVTVLWQGLALATICFTSLRSAAVPTSVENTLQTKIKTEIKNRKNRNKKVKVRLSVNLQHSVMKKKN